MHIPYIPIVCCVYCIRRAFVCCACISFWDSFEVRSEAQTQSAFSSQLSSLHTMHAVKDTKVRMYNKYWSERPSNTADHSTATDRTTHCSRTFKLQMFESDTIEKYEMGYNIGVADAGRCVFLKCTLFLPQLYWQTSHTSGIVARRWNVRWAFR